MWLTTQTALKSTIILSSVSPLNKLWTSFQPHSQCLGTRGDVSISTSRISCWEAAESWRPDERHGKFPWRRTSLWQPLTWLRTPATCSRVRLAIIQNVIANRRFNALPGSSLLMLFAVPVCLTSLCLLIWTRRESADGVLATDTAFHVGKHTFSAKKVPT
jgi:hypothetical protein